MYSRRSRVETRNVARRRKRRHTILLTVFCVVPLVLIGLLAYLLRLPSISIQTVTVEGASALAPADIQNRVFQKLSGSYFLLVPRRNVFFYPRTDIEQFLRAELPRIKEVRVERTSTTNLLVQVTEKGPYALWCMNIANISNISSISGSSTPLSDSSALAAASTTPIVIAPNDNCFYMDDTGFIFSPAPDAAGRQYIHWSGGLAAGVSPIGQAFLSVERFHNLQLLLNALARANLPVVGVAVNPDGYLEAVFPGGASLRFHDETGLDTLVENLKTLAKSDVFKGTGIATNTKLQYIDMRVPDKAFYKMR